MGNLTFVTTRKKIDPDKITEVLNDMNESYFQNKLIIDFNGDDKTAWIITYNDNYVRGCMWNRKKKISMKHGTGGYFYYWIHCVAMNQLALAFNGKLSDEGIDGSWEPEENYCRTFDAFLDTMYAHIDDEDKKAYLVNLEKEYTPKEFH